MQAFGVNQQAAFEHEGNNYRITIANVQTDVAGTARDVTHGFLRENTAFIFTNTQSNPVKIAGQKGYASTQLFKSKKINFEQLGIGGLDLQVRCNALVYRYPVHAHVAGASMHACAKMKTCRHMCPHALSCARAHACKAHTSEPLPLQRITVPILFYHMCSRTCMH